MVTKVSDLRPNPNPVDPNVKVPAAVQRAAAAAAAAQAAAYPENQPPVVPPAPIAPDTIVIAPPVEALAPVPAPTPAPVTPVGNEPPTVEPTWEHKLRSSEGRRVKLEQLLGQANDRITALEGIIGDMQQAPPVPTPVPTVTTPASRLITPQEESEFGNEMLDVMGRRAREIVSPEIEELRNTVRSLESKLTGNVTEVKRTARQNMLASLDSSMPEWRQVNDMAEFKTWLALLDPYFGVKRHNALLAAFEKNDTSRVLNFFRGFVSELAATAPDDALPAPTTPAEPQPAKPGLESLAAPGRARTPAHTTVPAEKQIITTADINAFYAAKARGAYNGREAEFAALEAELFKAQREGRVRAV